MRQHRTVILPSFATIFLCSLLLAASFTAFGAVMRVLSMEKNLYAIEAFLPESVSEDSLKVIQNRLEHTKFVDSVTFVSADSALADFRRHFSGEMLDLVEGNPIPPFFRVTLDEENKNPSTLVEVKNALAREEIFEEIQAPVEWVEKIAAWKFRMIFWPICISVLLLFTLSLIICNSVRLSLLSRRLLVENMKYAGGSHFFIEFPFVLQGAFQGLVGSGIAVILLAIVLNSVADAFPIVAANLAGLGTGLFLVVVLVTALSGYFSFRTVREFLSIKRNEQE
ncbi:MULTISPECIES: ABC transporter permease [unclassified Fibrobacter]|jgi:cell division transport system permease protein|uniref:cell division protein FtsX n=1 Tax=unclassified Fibrobacter TaxID=2634177 RepID=UPI0009231653|nr:MULTISPECIES: permease-like cell division protein FtsX [unclassified Fibrobacter]SHL58120.1 cell division protein FtsX [Fibrobacter sp. UWOV1]